MDNLKEKLNGLTITEEEEVVIDCEDDDEDVAMKNTFTIVWRLGKGKVAREIKHGIFMFQFFSIVDKAKVLEDGPLSLACAPLLLKEVEEVIQPSVKAEDVSLNKRTKSMAISMASSKGTFVEFDDLKSIDWSKYMRFKVDLKINKPYKRWIRITTPNGSKLFKFTYERLMDVCIECGCLGNGYTCSEYDNGIALLEMSYGTWLCASPTKKRPFINNRKKEEYKVCQEFKGELKVNKAQSRLYFEDSTKGKQQGDKQVLRIHDNPIV
ncbi:putative uncharacterized protein KIF25-AS1 [Bienertia sinuspersici]